MMIRTRFDKNNHQTSCVPSTDEGVAEVVHRLDVAKVTIVYHDGTRAEFTKLDDGQ